MDMLGFGLTYTLTFINLITHNGNFRGFESPSRIHCVTQCSLQDDCKSVFYHNETGACDLINETLSETSGLKPSLCCEYFVKEESRFGILIKSENGSSTFDLERHEWFPTNYSLPKYAKDVVYDGSDRLYSFYHYGKVGYTSVTTGKTVMITHWTNIEMIFCMNADVKKGIIFHTLLIDKFRMIKLNIYTSRNKTIHYLNKSYMYRERGVLALDRQKEKIYVIVVSPPYEGKEQSLLSMDYDGGQDKTRFLGSDKIYHLTFDEKGKQLVYASVSGIFVYDVNINTSKRLHLVDGVTAPKNVAVYGDVFVVHDEYNQTSRIKVYSRKGVLKQDLTNPFGPPSTKQFFKTSIVLIKQ